MSEDDVNALAAIAGTAAANIAAGSIVVAEVTSPATGILGVLGFTATTTVALPVASVIAVGGLLCFGWSKAQEFSKR